MKIKTMNDLLVDQIKDLYSAESQIIKTLPKLARKARNEKLKENFQKHLMQSQKQKEKLEKVCDILEIKPTGKKCRVVEGLLEEAKEIIEHVKDPKVLDAGLTITSLKVEHYEMAGLDTVTAVARELGNQEIATILGVAMDKEKEKETEKEEAKEAMSEVVRRDIHKRAVHG